MIIHGLVHGMRGLADASDPRLMYWVGMPEPSTGDPGIDPLPSAAMVTVPGPTTLPNVGCSDSTWVNNSVTNFPGGSNRNCLTDYWTGKVIKVDPATGNDAAGRPFGCHMPSYEGGPGGIPPMALPWICGTPAQRAATPDLATYRKQQHMPDPSDPYAQFHCAADPICAANWLTPTSAYDSPPGDVSCADNPRCAAASGIVPGQAPPPPPTPIFQQMATFTPAATQAPAVPTSGAGAQVFAAMPVATQAAVANAAAQNTPAPVAAATTGFSTQEILIFAGLGALVLYSLKGRQAA